MFTVFTSGGGGLLGNVGGIDHVDRFHLGRKFLLSPRVRTPGLLVIVVVQPLVLVFGIQLASLFEHPAISVSVIGWFVGGAMNLARAVEYSVQIGRTRSSSFEWLFPLTGFRAFEFGIDCRILGIAAVNAALMFVAT